LFREKTTDNTGGSRPAGVMTYLKESKNSVFKDQFAFDKDDTDTSPSIIYVQFSFNLL
jgi:hypothetical protein